MARIQSSPILSQIRVARTHSEQTVSLQALKDEVVGHVQRKEKWVETGILEALAKILDPVAREDRGMHVYPASYKLDEEESVWLLALQLMASFACGGPSFLHPLHAVDVIPIAISFLCPVFYPPQIVLTALRLIRNVAEATSLAPPGAEDASELSDAIFVPTTLRNFSMILTDPFSHHVAVEQKRLICGLISRLCKKSDHQALMVEASVLDALAQILAKCVVARGEVVPGAELIHQTDGYVGRIPSAAPRGTSLTLTLEAISAIIADSRFRACSFLCAPHIMAVFPFAPFSPPAKETRDLWTALESAGLAATHTHSPGAMEFLLPVVPIPPAHGRGSPSLYDQFAPLGAQTSRESSVHPLTFSFSAEGKESEVADPESPVIPWLIHLVQSSGGMESVAAASVLTSLFKAGFANSEREQALACLVVPHLCGLLKEYDEKELSKSARTSTSVPTDVADGWSIAERAPEVLARLVADSDLLQQAAHDCGVIKIAGKLLKDAYEPMPVQTPPRPWSPNPGRRAQSDEGLPACRVGPAGQLPVYAHNTKMRESALKLVAAMATINGEYQKELDKEDVMSYIIESLSPWPRKPKSPKEKAGAEKAGETGDATSPSLYGHNPKSVIIAACHAVRSLGRSVSILRTTLQDHEVWLPISKLMKHPDAEVQIGASSVVINLLTSCSPMIDALVNTAGIVKILCEQAHSLNPGLRLNSLWALKHLVLEIPPNLRKQVLEELEPGWLVQLINDDGSEEETRQQALRRRASGADEDEDMDSDAASETTSQWWWPALWNAIPEERDLLVKSPRMRKAEAKLKKLREFEQNPAKKARNESLAIQEQGLGFIRNFVMVMADYNEQTEMVDYLFTELGQDRLFGILADKLRMRVVGAYGRRYTKSRDTVVLHPQPRIIEHITFILVHIAASVPRHRQLVIAQTDLLQLLGNHFNSKDVGVRRALCHLFHNLSCLDNEEDRQPCAQRAQELEKLGVLAKLESLEQGDADLDVRERAKAVVAQLKSPTA
ncbi:armadillo-type protein [Podospora australis]|uniref:Armadillo-type protein n=1 Tax=Podospora australis TaxID=1536484 RepID=A0AAN6WJ97_9PEZI|nr:armadillo-type protein [Podospora australis]